MRMPTGVRVAIFAGFAALAVFVLAHAGGRQPDMPPPMPPVPTPSATPSPVGVGLPVPDTTRSRLITVAVQVVSVLANPNLPGVEKNKRTAAVSAGKLVDDTAPPAETVKPVPVPNPVAFTYLGAGQAQLRVDAAGQAFYVTFTPAGGVWRVEDVTFDGCARDAACPFDPRPAPTLVADE